jgi:hypothetical protein
MANRSKVEVQKELEDCALHVVELQKEVFELEQQREGAEPPADLEDQIQRKSETLKDAQARWEALKAEEEAAG